MTPAEAAHADRLRELFAAHLLALRPSSVLDVGCGPGHLLRACRTAGIPAEGVEADAGLREPLGAEGFAVHAPTGDGLGLPLADGAFDAVALRHVLHHVADPRRMVHEACRVAGAAVLVAEPWFDPENPAGIRTRELDDWIKSLERRLGRVHLPDLTGGEVCALAPPGTRARVVGRCAPDLPRPVTELDPTVETLLARLADPLVTREWHGRRAQARREGLCRNGTVLVLVRRNRDDRPAG